MFGPPYVWQPHMECLFSQLGLLFGPSDGDKRTWVDWGIGLREHVEKLPSTPGKPFMTRATIQRGCFSPSIHNTVFAIFCCIPWYINMCIYIYIQVHTCVYIYICIYPCKSLHSTQSYTNLYVTENLKECCLLGERGYS